MTSSARRAARLVLALAVAAGLLVGLTPPASAAEPGADPVQRALARLDQDADRALTIRDDGTGAVEFVGVPARAEVDNPAVRPTMSAGTAADAAVARYGAAVGGAQDGTTLERTAVQSTAAGDVARYQQEVDGVPVLGGQVVVNLRADGELSSMLSRTTDETSVEPATVAESDAAIRARDAFLEAAGAGAGVQVDSEGRWLVDAGLIGGADKAPARTVWRFEVARAADERRMILIDDRTGGVVINVDLIAHALDRVVCDDANVRRSSDVPCTTGFARTEGGAASAVADVNTAYDLSGVVADFYQQVAGVDLTQLLGRSVSGQKKLASTVRWCYTDAATACPYNNAFWNGSQMYYGAGYAGADDVVGHEMTHGFTERHSGLFYWGQSGAMNESISDIVGEIIDHRHPSAGDSSSSWTVGEDVPGYAPNGLRNLASPPVLGDPDKTSSTLYRRETCTGTSCYDDSDGVHTNSGVGNKTFYLISQGGSFNGQTITGIDAGDPTLARSARLWVLVDQSLTSGSDWADLAAVLDQSCQSLLSAGTAGFTAATCTAVHQATVATELAQTPTRNPQPPDAQISCPSGLGPVTLFDSESGPTASKLTGSGWTRDSTISHSPGGDWEIGNPTTAQQLSLTTTNSVSLPAGRASFLYFRQWRVLDYVDQTYYDAGTVEVDDVGDAAGPVDVASHPWVNGPADLVAGSRGNPAAGRTGFGGDSRGYLASRVDLSSFAGSSIKPRFTLNTDSAVGLVGWVLDDIAVYTCAQLLSVDGEPVISGSAQVGETLSATSGAWTPAPSSYAFQWLRSGVEIPGATASTYSPVSADTGHPLAVRVTASRAGFADTAAVSAPTSAVIVGSVVAGSVAVGGTPRVGETLTASSSGWQPATVDLAYQWLRGGAAIPGATASSYRPAAADIGSALAVRVTATKAGYAGADATSPPTGTVGAGVISLGPVGVAGTPRLRVPLSVTVGARSPAGAELTYRWSRDGVAVAGASAPTYAPVVADVGATLAVQVTASAPGYAATTASSAPTAAVAPGTLTTHRPTVKGKARVGRKLAAVPGSWRPSGVALSYQWLRNGKPVARATRSTYKLTARDKGKRISVRVTGTKAGYLDASATSKATGKVKPKMRKRR